MCRLWVSNLGRSTHRVLNAVIGTPKPYKQYINVYYKIQSRKLFATNIYQSHSTLHSNIFIN